MRGGVSFVGLTQIGAAGVVMMVGLMLLVLIWQQADTLTVRLQAHCLHASATPEAFLRVQDGQSTVGYDVAQAGTDPDDCEVLDSGGSATFTATTIPVTLRGTEMSLRSDTNVAGNWRIDSTTWEQPPTFTSSVSQPLLSRFPKLFFGVLMVGAIAGLVGHQWFRRQGVEHDEPV